MDSDRGDPPIFRPSRTVYLDTVGRPLVRGAFGGGVLLIVIGVVRPIWLAYGSVVTVALAAAAVASLISLAYAR